MKIDRNLNLVFSIEREEDEVFIHSMPISREVFEKYFLVISKAFAAIYTEGLNIVSGPRVAALMLRKIASDMGAWEGRDGVANGLMAEIRRLSNVILPGERGWTTFPLQDAFDRQLLDSEDLLEAEGVISFFICASAVHRRGAAKPILEAMAGLWGAQITSLNCTEFAHSLPISTETDSFGAEAVSSVPY